MLQRFHGIFCCALGAFIPSMALAQEVDVPGGARPLWEIAGVRPQFQVEQGVCLFPAVPTKPITLPEAIERVLCASDDYRKAWGLARQRAADIGVSRSALLPSLTGTFSDDWFHRATDTQVSFFNSDMKYTMPGLDASIRVPIYDFGGNLAKLRQARQTLAAAKAGMQKSLLDEAIGAADAFFDVVKARSTVDTEQSNSDVAVQTLDVVAGKVSGGASDSTQMLSARAELLQTRAVLIAAEGDLRGSNGKLAVMMGLDADAPIRIEMTDESLARSRAMSCSAGKTFRELADIAARENPRLRAARAELAASQESLAAAKATGMPVLSLRGRYNWLDQKFIGEDNAFGINQVPADNIYRSVSIGLQIEVPLYQGNIRAHRVRSARADVEQHEANAELVERSIMRDLWQSHEEMLAVCCNEPETLEELEATAVKSLEASRTRYRSGVAEILEVLEAERTLAKARRLGVDNHSSCRRSILKMSASLGAVGY